MTDQNWKFSKTGRKIDIEPPRGVDQDVSEALWDFITAEIGASLQNLNRYRKLWATVSSDPDQARGGIAGNGTRQYLDGDDVVLESLYDQWEPVRIAAASFDMFLQDYGQFLAEVSS